MSLDQKKSDLRLPSGVRIGAVVSSYHEDLTGAMLESARAVLLEAGLAEKDLLVVRVPGAFELPLVARRLAVREDTSAVLCFGLVLKGETRHDEYIAHAVSRGIVQVALETDTPVLFGVLTCDTIEQARARAMPDGKKADKGREVALAAVEQIAALKEAANVGVTTGSFGFAAKDRGSAGS